MDLQLPPKTLSHPPSHTNTHTHTQPSVSGSHDQMTYQTTQKSMAVREAGALISMSLGQWLLAALIPSISVIKTALMALMTF